MPRRRSLLQALPGARGGKNQPLLASHTEYCGCRGADGYKFAPQETYLSHVSGAWDGSGCCGLKDMRPLLCPVGQTSCCPAGRDAAGEPQALRRRDPYRMHRSATRRGPWQRVQTWGRVGDY
ncbi:hypothetical protein NDU88_001424 [Pleurodeles waltl]|uniref:Uncharacterized protein n=1 Tax=Pleurodeles waltl TaxID=8319 RepID=A0AAV7KPJ3_PLEWA|nr:hypothetical protein NDU88_001424 [Pleurodeles waltl]